MPRILQTPPSCSSLHHLNLQAARWLLRMLSLRATPLKSNKVVVLHLVSMTSKTILLLRSQIPDFASLGKSGLGRGEGLAFPAMKEWLTSSCPGPPEESQPMSFTSRWCSAGGTFSGRSLLRLLQVAQHMAGIPSLWQIWQAEKCRTTTEPALLSFPSLAGHISGLVEEKEVKCHVWEGQVSLVLMLMPMTAPFKGTGGNTKPLKADRGDKAALPCATRSWTRALCLKCPCPLTSQTSSSKVQMVSASPLHWTMLSKTKLPVLIGAKVLR